MDSPSFSPTDAKFAAGDADISRPAAPKVFGVMSIIFGSLTLMMTLFSACMMMAGKSDAVSKMMTAKAKTAEQREQIVAAYDSYQQAIRGVSTSQSAIFIVMSAGLIAIGIGQLRYRRWGRKWTLIWSAVGLVVLLFNIVQWMTIVGPAAEAFFGTLGKVSASGSIDARINRMMSGLMSSPWMAVVSALFYAPYPIIQMIWFAGGKAKTSMTA